VGPCRYPEKSYSARGEMIQIRLADLNVWKFPQSGDGGSFLSLPMNISFVFGQWIEFLYYSIDEWGCASLSKNAPSPLEMRKAQEVRRLNKSYFPGLVFYYYPFLRQYLESMVVEI
jgi:hypothetical protein